jgi:hypothetical protein
LSNSDSNFKTQILFPFKKSWPEIDLFKIVTDPLFYFYVCILNVGLHPVSGLMLEGVPSVDDCRKVLYNPFLFCSCEFLPVCFHTYFRVRRAATTAHSDGTGKVTENLSSLLSLQGFDNFVTKLQPLV